jgi:hypothetical protein
MTSKVPLPRHTNCATCGSLLDEEYAFQKNGWPADDSHLPAAAGKLELVKDLNPGGGRDKHLMRCPECGTYYHYRTDYEFLVGGTEDEQFLTRLTDAQAEAYLGE